LFEHAEAAIAARVGLAAAVRELDGVGLDLVWEHLALLGRHLRETLGEVPGWRVREPIDEPGALVTLEPVGFLVSPEEAVQRLRGEGIAGSVVPAGRASDLDQDVLRLSPEPGVTVEDIARVRDVLWRATRS
jgi:pyridoxal 5-phosphate dependent beta-lyase